MENVRSPFLMILFGVDRLDLQFEDFVCCLASRTTGPCSQKLQRTYGEGGDRKSKTVRHCKVFHHRF